MTLPTTLPGFRPGSRKGPAEVAQTEPVAGFPTHVVRLGGGVRRVLFIHCTLGSHATWTKLQAPLLDKLLITCFDRPSHGASAMWNGDGGPEGLHRLTTMIAAELIEGRADIVGHSYGATVALRLALELPHRVRSLTLIEPPLFTLAQGTRAWAAYDRAMEGFDAALAAGDNEAAARIFQAAMMADKPWDGLSDRARARLIAQIPRIGEERGVTVGDAPGLCAPGRLETLALPVLLIEGSASPAIVNRVHDRLAARVPQAQRVVVMGAGHMAPLTHPESVAAEIAHFLKL
ncbi:MAG: alpha/beta hydrolase [Rhodobacterales bacterium]|nr:MAG: alpha/beta hydrolase [Rhodobacterales bacterium]